MAVKVKQFDERERLLIKTSKYEDNINDKEINACVNVKY